MTGAIGTAETRGGAIGTVEYSGGAIGTVEYGAGTPMPPAETPAQAAARILGDLGIPGGHVIDTTFSDHNFRKWQEGIDGVRHGQYPATMFTDNAIFRMFRLRVSGSPVSINIWRGSASTYSYVAQGTPINNAAWFYIINCDDREWVALPIDETSVLTESGFAFTGTSTVAR